MILSVAGDLQRTVLAMRDCASEVSVALSAFGRVSRGQTALTSESGTMLDEVFVINYSIYTPLFPLVCFMFHLKDTKALLA